MASVPVIALTLTTNVPTYVLGTVSGTATLSAWTASGVIVPLPSVGGTAKLAAWTAEGGSGVTGQPELPAWTAAGGVTAPGWVTGLVELTAWTASGTVLTETLVSASVTLPAWTAEGATGAVAEVTLPVWTAAGTVTTPIIVSGAVTLPPWTATGSLYTGLAASGTATLPEWTAAGRILVGSLVTGAATLPRWTVSGTASSGTEPAVTETTYAVNLNTGAVTQLLLGTFDKLVTAHGRLYGLQSGGALVRLDGDLDGTSTTIPATIRFAPQQFGTLLAKRLAGVVYLNVREDDGVTLTVIADETKSWDYQSRTDTAPAMGTHPVHVGRGITFHSLGLKLCNRNGGRLDVGGVEIPVIPLSRRPR